MRGPQDLPRMDTDKHGFEQETEKTELSSSIRTLPKLGTENVDKKMETKR
jgi:hypothetical protein